MPKESQQDASINSHASILKLEFFGKEISLRCPIENQEILRTAAQKLKQKFDEGSESNMDEQHIILTTCLKYAFFDEIKMQIIQSTVDDLKKVKAQLVEGNSSSTHDKEERADSDIETIRKNNDIDDEDEYEDNLEDDSESHLEDETNLSPPSPRILQKFYQDSYTPPNSINEENYGRIIPATVASQKS